MRVFVVASFVEALCWFVPRLPMAGESLAASRLEVGPGGKGLNVAVGLHRLGVEVDALIGCGQDEAGERLLRVLGAEGLHTRHVHRFEAASSGRGAGFIAPDGQSAIAVHPGANLLLTSAHVEQAADDLDRARLVYGQLEASVEVLTAAFRRAHARGIPTVLNPSPWRELPAALRETTHTLIVNEVEASLLLGTEPSSLAALRPSLPALWETWPACHRLVVTVGERGCLAFERDGDALQAPALPVSAIDTVGAGDAFSAGLCAALAEGASLREALELGNACGAHVAARVGVLEALPQGRAHVSSRTR